MNHHTCKCGKREWWESGMFPASCDVCEDCGTTADGKPGTPHKLELRYNEKTGRPDHWSCVCCYKKLPYEEKSKTS